MARSPTGYLFSGIVVVSDWEELDLSHRIISESFVRLSLLDFPLKHDGHASLQGPGPQGLLIDNGSMGLNPSIETFLISGGADRVSLAGFLG